METKKLLKVKNYWEQLTTPISLVRVYQLVSEGRIPHVMVDGVIFIKQGTKIKPSTATTGRPPRKKRVTA